MAKVAILAQVEAFLQRQHGCFIDGQWVYEQALSAVYDPATAEVIAQVSDSSVALLEQAVLSAHQAFESGVWRLLRPADRERILVNFAQVIEAHAEELAQIESLNQGKSIHLTRALDVGSSLEYIRYMAGWSTKIEGQSLDVSINAPANTRFTAFTRREPLGVVAGIVPWNFPLMIAIWKIIPALATGNSIIIKPALETPLSVLRLAELALEAGIPAGVFNVITGDGARIGGGLAAHPLVKKVSFTGSTLVGRSVGTAALQNFSRFSLELGGKNPMLIFADADVDKAVQGAIFAGLLNSGQVCAAASRFYVHRSIYARFVDQLSQAVASMQIGPGMDDQSSITPLVSKKQQDAVNRYLDIAKQQGARVAYQAAEIAEVGYYVRPTILTDVSAEMSVVKEEVFGPVLVVIAFDEDDAAIAMANDSPYGLGASIWTNDLSKALNLLPRIQAGTVWVNAHVQLDPSMPFGGVKQSGIGREFGREVIDAFTEIKSVCIAH